MIRALLALTFFHASGTLLVAVIAALAFAGPGPLQSVADAYASGLTPSWTSLAVHVGLSACTWALLFLGYKAVAERYAGGGSDEEDLRIIRSSAGNVMVETLIVLPFLLLVTSGIAQLTMINVASVLADLAAWDGARAAWLWEAENDIGRSGVTQDDVRFRAMTAASMALAPTAGTDYTVGRNYPRGSGPPFRRTRTAIVASFRPGARHTGADEWRVSRQNWNYFNLFGGTGANSLRGAQPRDLSVAQAFDSVDFIYRAGRKCTQAFMNIQNNFQIVRENGQIGVHFTYRYNLLFPWYAYIFGQVGNSGMRTAYYTPIERKFLFPEQTQF